MFSKIVGVLGGDRMSPVRLGKWLGESDFVIAADGGFHNCLAAGGSADLVVGDFDSVDPSALPCGVHILEVQDQDSTDCQKLLHWVFENGYDRVHLACTEGDLPDHQLDTLFVAARSPLDIWFIFQRGYGRIIRGNQGRREYVAKPGSRVSLIPLSECSGVTITAVQWPLQNDAISPTTRTSISNKALGHSFSCGVSQGAALLFVESNELVWKESSETTVKD